MADTQALERRIRQLENVIANAKGRYGTVEQRLNVMTTGDIGGGLTEDSPIDHSTLTHRTWSNAGHTINTNVDFDLNQAQDMVIHTMTEAQRRAKTGLASGQLAHTLTPGIYLAVVK